MSWEITGTSCKSLLFISTRNCIGLKTEQTVLETDYFNFQIDLLFCPHGSHSLWVTISMFKRKKAFIILNFMNGELHLQLVLIDLNTPKML